MKNERTSPLVGVDLHNGNKDGCFEPYLLKHARDMISIGYLEIEDI